MDDWYFGKGPASVGLFRAYPLKVRSWPEYFALFYPFVVAWISFKR